MLFANFGQNEAAASLAIIKKLRTCGISAEIYPDNAKMKKQIGFANAMNVPFFAIVGETELSDGTVTIKNMNDGTQTTVKADELADIVKQ